jgi:Ca2+/Na+ antiporter
MDQANPFESRNTFRLHRAEYFVLWVISAVLLVIHFGDVRWLPALLLFFYIDLIGYLPGAIAHHRSVDKKISKVYYVLYNVMHSLITQTVVVGVWGLTIGWEWALLVVPFHLFGDRALFGNFLKPFRLSFEPVRHPAYQAISVAVDKHPAPAPQAESIPVAVGAGKQPVS